MDSAPALPIRSTAATGSASHLRGGSDDEKVETMSSDLTLVAMAAGVDILAR
jgi:hypothetical protein